MPSCSNDSESKGNWNCPVSHMRGTSDGVLMCEPLRSIRTSA
ncbi:Protein of unknown function [Pyronema omphalodes CBS 100304]|uniref:Uncharacterized protein n=1 Tax=Pyronema omphalodes (strain CBS 100304) TaxID=1076935 RepID=U4LCK5_PYROM|nr:Protein of unknown function [Pyronema omphalodes CBS 100304]